MKQQKKQTQPAFFVELVKNLDGTYYANMIVDGNRVEGLPRNGSYEMLKDAIEESTGITIWNKSKLTFSVYHPEKNSRQHRGKDGNFEEHYEKQYVYLCNNYPHDEVGTIRMLKLQEILCGFHPNFQMSLSETDPEVVYLPPRISRLEEWKDQNLAIRKARLCYRMAEVVTDLIKYPARIRMEVEEKILEDGSIERLDRPSIYEYGDYAGLYETTLAKAEAKANSLYQKMAMVRSYPKGVPVGTETSQTLLDAVDVTKLTDQELIEMEWLVQELLIDHYCINTSGPMYQLSYKKAFRFHAMENIQEERSARIRRQNGQEQIPVICLTRHGLDDFSVWFGQGPRRIFGIKNQIALYQADSLRTLFEQLPDETNTASDILYWFQHEGGFQVSVIQTEPNWMESQETEGFSERGTMEEVIAAILSNERERRPERLLGYRRLQEADVYPDMDVMEEETRLEFYLAVNFDPDALFGFSVCTAENDDYINIYATYDLEQEQVAEELEVYLVQVNGTEKSYQYRLSPGEKQMLETKMEAYVLHTEGIHLADHVARYRSEEE